jgi:hypothetical protein
MKAFTRLCLIIILCLLVVPQGLLAKSVINKKRFELVVRNSLKNPLKISKFKIQDKGINNLNLKDIANQFYVKVKNQSRKNILAYKLRVKEYTPFQDDSVREIIITSTKKLKPRKTDKAYQERMINFHLETLYIIAVEEVLFEDGTVWSADNGIIKPQGNAGK